ncbi:hypothetical protein PSCICJ_14280 [Pseudomonas cichorii]|nr:hypothetical protein PSCICJ_14280 [Pseudomonas cichorii]
MLLRKLGCDVQTASAIPKTRVDYDLVVTDFDLDRAATGADSIAICANCKAVGYPQL